MIGPATRQGGHQGAQKSMITGTPADVTTATSPPASTSRGSANGPSSAVHPGHCRRVESSEPRVGFLAPHFLQGRTRPLSTTSLAGAPAIDALAIRSLGATAPANGSYRPPGSASKRRSLCIRLQRQVDGARNAGTAGAPLEEPRKGATLDGTNAAVQDRWTNEAARARDEVPVLHRQGWGWEDSTRLRHGDPIGGRRAARPTRQYRSRVEPGRDAGRLALRSPDAGSGSPEPPRAQHRSRKGRRELSAAGRWRLRSDVVRAATVRIARATVRFVHGRNRGVRRVRRPVGR